MARDEMNRQMRDILIEHIDLLPLPVVHCMQAPPAERDRIANRHMTLAAAWRRGWVNFDRFPHPRQSTLTPAGRAALAEALGDWADALFRAGLDRQLLPDVSGEIAEAKELAKPVEF
jgi:hypothetical protein